MEIDSTSDSRTSKSSDPPLSLDIPTSEQTATMMDVDSAAAACIAPDDAFKTMCTNTSASSLPSPIPADHPASVDPANSAWPPRLTLKRVVPPMVIQVKDSNVMPDLRAKMEEVFSKYLSLADTKKMLEELFRSVRNGEETQLLTLAMQTLTNMRETMGRMPTLGSKVSKLKGRQVALPVFRFMDGVCAAVLRGAPPASPSRKPKEPEGDLSGIDFSLSPKSEESGKEVDRENAEVGALSTEFDKKLGGGPCSKTEQVSTGEPSGSDTDMVDHREVSASSEPKLNGHVAVENQEAEKVEGVGFASSTLATPSDRKPPLKDVPVPSKGPKLKKRLTEIPPFYPRAAVNKEQQERERLAKICEFFAKQRKQDNTEGISKAALTELVTSAIGLPSYISPVIFEYIVGKPRLPSTGALLDETAGMSMNINYVMKAAEMESLDLPTTITEEEFMRYYRKNLRKRDKEECLFKILLYGVNRTFLIPDDWRPMTIALLNCHPGLQFLRNTPEFQQRYCETVIQRIYYGCTRMHNSRLTLGDLKRSRFMDTLMALDHEDDINRERKFFSYEHFYVLYCRFWELDNDHDLLIDRDDLMRYDTHALSYRIVDRIFGGYGRPLDCSTRTEGKMTYTDFVWFCISEEDKTSDTAIDYWFRCLDLDGDGFITLYDMEYFYKEQLHRLECFGSDTLSIRDMFCQLFDMIKPNVSPPQLTRRDLKGCRMASVFFNTLFNVNKYFIYETKDPSTIRHEQATPDMSDWDRFAAQEYIRLSNEDEYEEMEGLEEAQNDLGGPVIGEAPF